MVHIKPLEKPDLKVVKMNCDGIIHDKLATKYGPMVAEAFSTSSFNIICGTMGSGKSSLITALVKTVFRKCFESIYVFMPENSRQSIENDIYGKHLPGDQLFDTLSEENISSVYQRLQNDSKEGYHSLLIIDDFQTQLKQPEINNVIKKIVTKMRHLRCTIFLLVQNWQSVPKPLRELVSNVITFNIGKSQLEKLFIDSIQINKHKYEQIIDLCFKEKHDFMLINLNKSKSIYRNFDLVVLD
jgi:hypothetical protein